MQATRQEIVALAENLGYKTAGKWNKARMEEKLLTIAQLDSDGEEIEGLEDDDQKKLLAMIIKNKGVVEIVKEASKEETSTESEASDATEPEGKPAKKGAAKKDKTEAKDETSTESEASDATEPEGKPAKKGAAKKDKTEAKDESNDGKTADQLNAEINKLVPGGKKGSAKKTSKEASKDKFGCRVGSQAATINASLTGKKQTIEQISTSSGVGIARVKGHLKSLVAKELVTESDGGYAVAKKS
jgi:hypothetical protein